MNKFISILITCSLYWVLGGCNSSTTPGQEESRKQEIPGARIDSLERELYKDPTGPIDKNQAEITLSAYNEFVSQFPKDKKSPEYLFKAGQLATALQKYDEAVQYYEAIVKDFSDYEKAPVALFLEAFVYDNYLNDDKKAGEMYQLFISKYPSNELVKDAQFSLHNIGKSDEELIKEFESKQKK